MTRSDRTRLAEMLLRCTDAEKTTTVQHTITISGKRVRGSINDDVLVILQEAWQTANPGTMWHKCTFNVIKQYLSF